jgi:tetratricopeptide (TPR) repeat protein
LIALATVTYRQLGYWHTSESLWVRALSVTQNNYVAHGNLADTLARQHRSDQAIVHYEAAAALHEYPAATVLVLGSYEQQHGHIETAIEHFKKVAESTDSGLRGSALDHLGSAYLQTKNPALAKVTYAQALQIDPNDPVALMGSGLVAYGTNPELAAQQFSHAVAVQPSDVRLLLQAAALRRSGHPAEAQMAYERAKKVSPNLRQAQQAANQLLGDGISN